MIRSKNPTHQQVADGMPRKPPQYITIFSTIPGEEERSIEFDWHQPIKLGTTCFHCWFQRFSWQKNAQMHTLADAYRQIRPQYWESRNAKNAAIALYGMATGTQRWALEKTINDIEFYLDLHPRIIFTMREISRFYRHQFYKIDHNNNLAESNCGLVFKFDRGTEQDRISETHLSYLYTRKSQRLELVQLDRVNNQTFMSSPSPYG